jgi:predicted ATPase
VNGSAVIRTPDQRVRVFVSSTLEELAEERAAVREAITRLRLVPVMFELGARPHPPREVYRSYLEQSDVFVGLYWQRYGWVAPDMTISGLEDEWRLADSVPRLVYMKTPAPDREPALGALVDQIRDDGSTSYRSFTSIDELRELVENDLAVLLTERFEAAKRPPEPGRSPLRSPLPHPATPIVGREVELRTVEELLLAPDHRLVTLTGAGGSGKTRLALELTHRLGQRFDGHVCFVDLTGLRSWELVIPTIASTLGIRDAGQESLVDAIATVVDDRALLLVLDNFEHVMDAARQVGDLLASCAGVTVLATSRQPLHLRWEHEFAVLPLDVPGPDAPTSVDVVSTSPAVELLVERAQRVKPGFAVSEDNAAPVAEIARRLDGLPLALELAAARLRILSPDQLLDRLEHRLDALAGSAPDLPDRHRTLREALRWSHDLLTDEERALFRRMGVFAGGATLEAIEAVCAGADIDAIAVLDLVDGLVDKSLVVSVSEPGGAETRFALLETVRELAVEEMVAAGEAERVWDRHLRWHVELADRAWEGFWTAEMIDWLDLLDREHDNLRTAMDHAAGAGDPVQGARIAALLWPFLDVRGHHREWELRLESLLERTPPDALECGRGLATLGWLISLRGDFESALAVMEGAVPVVRASGDDRELAWTLAELGNVSFGTGNVHVADRLWQESIELAQKIEDEFLSALGIFGLAYVAFLGGDLPEMVRLMTDARDRFRECGQPWGLAWAQLSMALASVVTGDTRAALAPITESLELRWAMQDHRGLAECLELLACLASVHEEFDWSALLHGAAELQREANGLPILPFLEPLHAQSMGILADALGEERFDEIRVLGRSAPMAKIVNEALERVR